MSLHESAALDWDQASTLGYVKWNSYQAVLFDLDGVLTPTSELHQRAWEQMFNDYLSGLGISEPYTENDYFRYVDGKPRYEGVLSFLTSRGIKIPAGDPGDDPTTDSVAGLGNRKNSYFNQLLARDGIQPYPGSLDLLVYLRSIGFDMAVVSSSCNAKAVLKSAGLTDFFSVIMDGHLAGHLGLPGKPASDVFVRAALMLDADPRQCVVIEDAVSGVRAGSAGGFGLVVGINRGAGAEALVDAGADLVVGDCGELAA